MQKKSARSACLIIVAGLLIPGCHASSSCGIAPVDLAYPPPTDEPRDTEHAATDIHSSDTPRLEDANRLHQARTDDYIEMLDEEDMATALRRLYMYSEIYSVMAASSDGHITVSMTYNNMVLSMKTRRYRKLYDRVVQDRDQGRPEQSIQLIAESVDIHLNRLDEIREGVIAQIQADPTVLEDQDRYRDEIHDLWIARKAVFPVDFPEGVLPVTQLGAHLSLQITANLLGHSQSASALPALLQIADYDATRLSRWQNEQRGRAFSDEVYRNSSKRGRPTDMAVLVDAMDRILLHDQPVNDRAAQLQQAYRVWREARGWPERTTIASYAYDSPQSPHELQGVVFSPILGGEFQQQVIIEAPLVPARTREYNVQGVYTLEHLPGISVEETEMVVDWAREYSQLHDDR